MSCLNVVGKRKSKVTSHQPTKMARNDESVCILDSEKDSVKVSKSKLCLDSSILVRRPISVGSSSSSSDEAVVDLTADTPPFIDLTSSPTTKTMTRTSSKKQALENDEVVIIPSPPCSPHSPTHTSPSSKITCPICMETKETFTKAGKLLVSTKCGHIFCDSCIRQSIGQIHKCPLCFTKLTLKQYHSIYI